MASQRIRSRRRTATRPEQAQATAAALARQGEAVEGKGGSGVGAVSRTECCGNRNVDKAEAISRAAAAAAAENCCAREKAKKGRKISIGFSIFFSLFVFVLFGVDVREGAGWKENSVGISLLCLLCGCHRAHERGG